MVKLVITLAPPDLPFPFEAMEILILKQLLPIFVPCSGLCSNSSISEANSSFSEGYFFTSRFNCLSKGGMANTLQLI